MDRAAASGPPAARVGSGDAGPPVNRRVVVVGFLLLAGGAVALADGFGWRQGALLAIGAALGLVLYHAAFGFTAAWRVFLADREGAGLRAQMLMLTVAVLVFYPALAAGELFGRPVWGFVAPAGVSVLIGAFVFGIGMQLGNGCASGTLYTVGGGSTKMVVTLVFFILGSLVATHHLDWWLALPSMGAYSLPRGLGLVPALALTLALFAAIAALTMVLERRRHGRVRSIGEAPRAMRWPRRLLRGPWPLVWGAVGLAVLNILVLWVAGRPWGVTSAFALWGGQVADGLGFAAIRDWPYWAAREGALDRSIFADITTVTNVGILLGAFVAAGLAGRFRPEWRQPWRPIAAAVVGGLLMGYGARLAFGCNIGAYFSGVASGSLHGWLWLVAGFAGSVVGVRLRPLFGLSGAGPRPS